MRPLRKAILAGAAAIAVAGVGGLAVAAIKNTHVLDVRLPDGSLAHIRYVGDTPPTVSFAPAALSILSPVSEAFEPDPAFVALDRVAEAMDRQADAMLHDVAAQSALAFDGRDLTPTEVGKALPGAQGFSVVSTLSGNGVCTRSVQYRSLGDGKPPEVVTRTSGNCPSAEQRPAPPVTSGATAETPRPERAGGRLI